MIVAVLLIALIAIVLLIAMVFLTLKVWEPERIEKARIEREIFRAEFHLHEIASEAFSALLEAARERGSKLQKE
jgi:hypothetical protein